MTNLSDLRSQNKDEPAGVVFVRVLQVSLAISEAESNYPVSPPLGRI